MSRCPGATWRPLAADPSHQAPMNRHDGIVLHTMAGSLAGTEAMFLQSGGSGRCSASSAPTPATR